MIHPWARVRGAPWTLVAPVIVTAAGLLVAPAVAPAGSPEAAPAAATAAGSGATSAADARIEARSSDLMAVGIVHDARMAIHVSRLRDNAPVRDAALTVLLRGVLHPTVAEADGGYTLQTQDLGLPGSAAVVFQIAAGDLHEDLKGTLQIVGPNVKPDEDKNSARQLGWWVLNFAVCIGFLMLLSRRRKAAAARGD